MMTILPNTMKPMTNPNTTGTMSSKLIAYVIQCLLFVLLITTAANSAFAKDRIRYHINGADGSALLVVDEKGVAVEHYRYSPFGEQLAIKKPANQRGQVGFVGGLHEKNDLVYLKQRYYNPVIGRFYQPDPVGYISGGAGQINRYQYGWNDPYTFQDPSGLDSEDRIAGYYSALNSDLQAYFQGKISFQQYSTNAQMYGALIANPSTAFDPANLLQLGVIVLDKRIPPVKSSISMDVWALPATARGNYIESYLAKTEYKDWFNVGQLNNGKFPMVDFQKGNTLLSLKTVDTNGSTWYGRMESHIDELASRGATVNNVRANMILDLRVQPGGLNAATPLIDYGRAQGVTVIVKEFK